ncbi:MAG: methionyl-tRNA synthetase [Geoglossum umbratile]|nr:MAG: methionyl-tRNA synthetase [Geoglossum umbratile]
MEDIPLRQTSRSRVFLPQIQQAAANAGMEPKAFCDQGAQVFKKLAERAEISHDHFVRTTDSDHRDAVQYFWFLLKERGYIFPAKHEGWYSVSDETFYPESAVHLVLDAQTGRKIMASIETGSRVEWTSEFNYHFRLSALKDRLLEFYRQNPKFVVPASRMADVVKAVSSGLQDLSVSRPIERLMWGIRVPDDEKQTIYVWLDALVNYITKAGYPWTPGGESDGGWPADCQVIGKDIVRFHCIYWPAFLLALDIPPPKQVFTHAHWTLGRQKMAKSTGNVVNPFHALDRFGVDTMRYYLALDGGISDDADYENRYIIKEYKKGLHGGLGNLTSRIMRGKRWDVRRAVESAGRPDQHKVDELALAQRSRIQGASGIVKSLMNELDVGGALRVIMSRIYQTNKYINDSAPWDLAMSDDPADKAQLDRVIYLSVEAVRVCGILLQPFMPGKMAQLMEILGVEPGRRTFEHAKFGADTSYGTPKVDLGKGTEGVLFPPLVSDI